MSREELASLVDKCVFMNCAGFIRIRDKHFYDENVYLGMLAPPFFSSSPSLLSPSQFLIVALSEPLDDTRIHPEDYRLARKMAADALDCEGDGAVLQECIYAIMEKPKTLDEIGMFLSPPTFFLSLPRTYTH